MDVWLNWLYEVEALIWSLECVERREERLDVDHFIRKMITDLYAEPTKLFVLVYSNRPTSSCSRWSARHSAVSLISMPLRAGRMST
jgi:hypothetical protein